MTGSLFPEPPPKPWHRADYYDGKPPAVRSSATSQAAADSIAPEAGTLRALVYRTVQETLGGLTCDEVEERLAMRHQTASARIRELAQSGQLLDSGTTRPTRSGRAAVVYVARR